MTSLDIHSACRRASSSQEASNGDFWDTGVPSEPYRGGDHWSQTSAEEYFAETRPVFTIDRETGANAMERAQLSGVGSQ